MYVTYVPDGDPYKTFLAECDKRYDTEVQMIGRSWSSPGYHTRYPAGAWAHPTRDNLEYALVLLRAPEACTEGEGRTQRASQVIRRVLSLQDTDPTSKTYGIWPWLLEEPLDQMAPPDWNWADFNGALLAQMLAEHADRLPEDLGADMREGLGHAAWAIFRRNVGPSYTNIAVLGGFVTAAAGELLNEPRLLDYGRRRLRNIIEHTEYHGGFNEYNSPNYTMVVLHTCERALQIIEDEEVRAIVEELHRMTWAMIAEHYHPATAQWAGPHSRSYRDRLDETTHRVLLTGAGLMEEDRLLRLVDPRSAPAALAERFRALPQPEVAVIQSFIRSPEPWASRDGTTWLSEARTLGTVDYESLWTQRRPLIGYWVVPDAPPAVLRVRCLHDGRDFASVAIHNAQSRWRVLSGFGLLTHRGDWHLHLDHPEDDIFHIADLRVRYELDAEGAEVQRIADDRFELSAGDHRAVVYTLAGVFDGRDVAWEMGEEDGTVWVDAICYRGPRRGFDFAEVSGIRLAAGLEMLEGDEAPLGAGPLWQRVGATTATVAWPAADLTLMLPLQAHPSH